MQLLFRSLKPILPFWLLTMAPVLAATPRPTPKRPEKEEEAPSWAKPLVQNMDSLGRITQDMGRIATSLNALLEKLDKLTPAAPVHTDAPLGQSSLQSDPDVELQGAACKSPDQLALEKLPSDRNLEKDTRNSRPTLRLDWDCALRDHPCLASPPAANAPLPRQPRDTALHDTAHPPPQRNCTQHQEAATPRPPHRQPVASCLSALHAAVPDPPAPARPERNLNMQVLSQPELQPCDGRADALVDWRAFISQFTRTADCHHWTEEEKLDCLVEQLRDKALVFFSCLEAEDQNDFGRLCNQLAMRFQTEESPAVLQKHLQIIRQEIEEPLEEFASGTQQLDHDAFPQFGPAVVQPMAVDAFLRGCRDKLPAFSVMSQGPATVQDAMVQVRRAQSSQTAVFGSSLPKVRRLRFLEENLEPTQVAVLRNEFGRQRSRSPTRTRLAENQ